MAAYIEVMGKFYYRNETEMCIKTEKMVIIVSHVSHHIELAHYWLAISHSENI